MVKLVRRVGSDGKVRYSALRVFRRRPVPYWPVIAVAGTAILLAVLALGFRGYEQRWRPRPTVDQVGDVAAIKPTPPVSDEPALESAPNAPPISNAMPDPLIPQLKAPREKAPNPVPVSPPPAARVAKSAESPKQEPLPVTAPFRRREIANADELAKQLLTAPEVGLEHLAAENLFIAGAHQRNQFPHKPPEPLLTDPQLVGLPVRMGVDCHLSKEASENLQILSRKLRVYLSESAPKDGLDTRPDVVMLRKGLFGGADGARGVWQQAEAIPTLVQVLQGEDKPMRLLLVELLSGLKCREASAALAQRAVFDLSDEARQAAVQALKDRPREEYRDVLLKAFRYPWAPAADHAAEALVALQDGDALGQLVNLLDRPDPEAAFVKGTKAKQTVVREVVRINHLKNCVLCHAPAFDQQDPVRGLVPDPKKPVPPSFTPQYYSSNDGRFVRADITYLKQDFAVPQPVAKHGAWPANQRYDYLVRTRLATPQDIKAAKPKASYPQRESVLFALREITGKDAGPTAADWRAVVAQAQRRVDTGEDE